MAAGLALLCGALFFPALAGRGAFFQRDIHAYWYPNIENAVRAVLEGGWPAWNPYVAFGRPLLADPNLQLLYPPTWLNLVVQPQVYYAWFVAFHCWLAGFGVYTLARRQGLSTGAAALAGAAWTSSGPLLSAVSLFHHFAGAAWMPWVLVALSDVLAEPTTRRAARLGVAAGLQGLAGSADLCLLTALAGLVQILIVLWTRRGSVAARSLLQSALVAALLAAGLGAAQWLPVLAVVSGGSRGRLDAATSEYWSVHPLSLIDAAVPRLVTDLPMSPALRSTVFEGRGPLLACLYLGAACLPLAVLGALRPRAPRGWALGGLALFAMAALGRHAPVYGLIAAVPPYSMLRYPAKYMIPASLFWALLAGLGLEALLRSKRTHAERRSILAASIVALATGALLAGAAAWMPRHPERVGPLLADGDRAAAVADAAARLQRSAWIIVVGGALLAAGALAPPRTSWAAAAVAALAVADLYAVGRTVNPLAPPSLLLYRPPLATALQAAGPGARLYVESTPLDQLNRQFQLAPAEWRNEAGWALGMQQMLVPPTSARWRIHGSYDGDFTGMARPELSALSLLIYSARETPLALEILRLGGVTHVISMLEPAMPGLAEVQSAETVYGRPARLLSVPEALPRAYVVHRARRLDPGAGWTPLTEHGLDPRTEVLLPDAPDGAAAAPSGAHEPAHIVARGMDRLAIDVDTAAPGWLVVLEAYDAGWTAQVDGRPAPIHRANWLFRAVPVAAGRHRVDFRYHTPWLRPGLCLSAGAVLAALALALPLRRDATGEGPA